VLGFLLRRALERLPRARVARRQRLALVERLRADLAGVVDAHQRRRVRAALAGKLGLGKLVSRHRAQRLRRSKHRAQAPVEGNDQIVERG
jgi:hypothetical protein